MTNLNAFIIANFVRRHRTMVRPWEEASRQAELAAYPELNAVAWGQYSTRLAWSFPPAHLEQVCYEAWLWHNRMLTDSRTQVQNNKLPRIFDPFT